LGWIISWKRIPERHKKEKVLYKGVRVISIIKRVVFMPQINASVNIENVVASATLNQKIDLKAVVKSYNYDTKSIQIISKSTTKKIALWQNKKIHNSGLS